MSTVEKTNLAKSKKKLDFAKLDSYMADFLIFEAKCNSMVM